MARVFDLGVDEESRIPRPLDYRRRIWVRFEPGTLRMEGRGHVVSRKCETLEDLEREINEIKRNLDGVLDKAKSLKRP